MSEDGAIGPKSVLEKATVILEAFPAQTDVRTLEQITASSGLPRSTTHRILDQLAQLGWVQRHRGGYRLGPRTYELGRAPGDGHGPLRAAAAPHLDRLARETGLIAYLAVLAGAEIICLDKVGGREAFRVPGGVGLRAPAVLTAEGRAMLAALDDEARADVLGADGWGEGWLEDELAQIRAQRGLAFNTSANSGLSAVAVAIPSTGGRMASISLAGSLPLAHLRPMARLVTQAVDRIHATLRKADDAER